MDECSRHLLQTQRATLRHDWEQRLRAAQVSSPLAHPDALVHLMDWTLDRLLQELTMPARPQGSLPPSPPRPCLCGRNPFTAYFATAQAALAHVIEAAGLGGTLDASQTFPALARIARAEIDTFCALCLNKEERFRAAESATSAIAARDVTTTRGGSV